MSELPSWYPGSEKKPAPMPLLRVQGFLNTRDLEDETDLLVDPATARPWLFAAGLVWGEADVSESDLAIARDVREAIRGLIDNEGENDLEPLRRLAAAHSVRLTVEGSGAVELECAGHADLGDGLFELLLIIHQAREDGSWSRLKVCANDECRWAFYDRSRNQQGSWCNMAVCGNRVKNREFRARRR